MKISARSLTRIIKEEIRVFDIKNRGSFGYVMQQIIDRPDEPVSNDLVDPVKGNLILSKGQTFRDISPEASYQLMKIYNIESEPRAYLPEPRRTMAQKRAQQVSHTPAPATDASLESVASALRSFVSSGSRPLRNDIKEIVLDHERGHIAVYLNNPKRRLASDQEIACALRNLIDNRINPIDRYAISPCGFKDRPYENLMVIVKV